MCGLAGFAGIKNHKTRVNLVYGLGLGIDSRGRDAAGYLSINNGVPKYSKKLGLWQDARYRFWNSAAKGEICMMHARFATCGNKTIDEAHPFAIWRKNKVSLWGAHNGQIYTAKESATKHNRKYSVDSKELFELLADQNYDDFEKQRGYGVITWIESDKRDTVYVARLTEHSDFSVVTVKGGGMVWGSTDKIISNALEMSNLQIEQSWNLSEIGKVYAITTKGISYTDRKNLSISKGTGYSSSYNSNYSYVYGHQLNGKKSKDDDDDEKKYHNWQKLKNGNQQDAKEFDSKSSKKNTDDIIKQYDIEKMFEEWEKAEEEAEKGIIDPNNFKNFLD